MTNRNQKLLKKLILESFLGGNKEKFLKIRFYQEKFKQFQLDLIQRAQFNKRTFTLDVGFGMGGLITALALQGYKTVGIEPILPYIKITKLRLKRYKIVNKPQLIQSVAEKMPFENNSFSQICCFDIIEHLNDPEQLFKELARITKKGGKVIITVPNRLAFIDPHFNLIGINYLPRKFGQLLLDFKKYSKKNYAGNQNLINMHYFTYPALVKLAHKNNFIITDLTEEKLSLNLINKIAYLAWRAFFSGVFVILLKKN